MSVAQHLVAAAFAQVILVMCVLGLLVVRRWHAFRAGQASPRAMIDDRRWPVDALKAGNNYKNQFEVPVLFFAGVGIALATNAAGPVIAAFAWAFVAARVVHAAVHVWPNVLAPRFLAMLVSIVCVCAIWTGILVNVMTGR